MTSFLRTRWKTIAVAAVIGLCVFYLGTSYMIGRQVRDAVAFARSSQPGDPITALMSVVNSPDVSMIEKNNAVWALGQLGDARALDTLEALITGEECDHTVRVCQHELEKAIQLCRGGRNIGARVWRRGDLRSG